MSNKYSEDGQSIIDCNGKLWQVNVWHPTPMPAFYNNDPMAFGGPMTDGIPAYWLARPPLPELPKTQDQIDRAAYAKAMADFIKDAPMHPDRESGFIAGWWRAIAWERSRK